MIAERPVVATLLSSHPECTRLIFRISCHNLLILRGRATHKGGIWQFLFL